MLGICYDKCDQYGVGAKGIGPLCKGSCPE